MAVPIGLKCFECAYPAVHRHHVLPRSLGGTKTVPLCEVCHGLIHYARFESSRNRISHGLLVRIGLEAALARGVRLGAPRLAASRVIKAKALRERGLSYRAIAKKLKISVGAVYNICRET